MVAVAMGDDGEIELGQVDTLGCDIVREDLRIVAGIEQDAQSGSAARPGKEGRAPWTSGRTRKRPMF
jgi:hypothetical protein